MKIYMTSYQSLYDLINALGCNLMSIFGLTNALDCRLIVALVFNSHLKGAMHRLQAKPYKYRCSSCQAAGTSELANRLFHVLGKDYL